MDIHLSRAVWRNGETVMTKAKARSRAKARAAAKAANPASKSTKPDDKVRKGYFDTKSNPMRSSGADVKNIGGMQRGAARSR